MADPCVEREDDTPLRTRELLAGLRAVTGDPCAGCGALLCGHGAVLSWVLGYRSQPRCGPCLAQALGEEHRALAERALQWILRRDCFLRGWLWASAVEGQPGAERPACQFGDASTPAAPTAGREPAAEPFDADAVEADDEWDAGQLGCGDLVLELRNRLRALEPASVLRVRAEDPAAPVDLPAWCGLTGHTLLSARHPVYLLMRREDA
ncbi:MAG: sulfurtransferase TusA family protein [Planctomycetota bacterium]